MSLTPQLARMLAWGRESGSSASPITISRTYGDMRHFYARMLSLSHRRRRCGVRDRRGAPVRSGACLRQGGSGSQVRHRPRHRARVSPRDAGAVLSASRHPPPRPCDSPQRRCARSRRSCRWVSVPDHERPDRNQARDDPGAVRPTPSLHGSGLADVSRAQGGRDRRRPDPARARLAQCELSSPKSTSARTM